jgi:hypothetical protein
MRPSDASARRLGTRRTRHDSSRRFLGKDFAWWRRRRTSTHRRRRHPFPLRRSAAGAWLTLRARPAKSRPTFATFTVDVPAGWNIQVTDHIALSSDGRSIAFTAAGPDHRRSLWLRALCEPAARQVSGSESAVAPFWSADHSGRFTTTRSPLDRRLRTNCLYLLTSNGPRRSSVPRRYFSSRNRASSRHCRRTEPPHKPTSFLDIASLCKVLCKEAIACTTVSTLCPSPSLA